VKSAVLNYFKINISKFKTVIMRNYRDPMKKFNNYVGLYPYKQILPATLKDKVSGKGGTKQQPYCLQEMSHMLVCLRKYEFDQGRCSKEIEAFNSCNKDHEKMLANTQSQTVVTEGHLPTELVDSQLKKYPQESVKKD